MGLTVLVLKTHQSWTERSIDGRVIAACWVSGRQAISTIGADTPEHDLGFIDSEIVIVCRFQTGRLSSVAIGIRDTAAAAAHQMVMVITYAPFKARRVASRPDLTHEMGVYTSCQYVIDRLLGNRSHL